VLIYIDLGVGLVVLLGCRMGRLLIGLIVSMISLYLLTQWQHRDQTVDIRFRGLIGPS
jgi:hypothetical protein